MTQATTSAVSPSSGDGLDVLERAIVERIREFEVPALLDLLASIGYGAHDVEFRGHLARGPQPTLVHAIEFPARAQPTHTARRVVIITVNLGLLSCRSPLPSYFQRFLADMDTRDGVLELLEMLDRSLLHMRLTCARPDRMVDRWAHTQQDFVRNFGLDSPIGLDWLFRQVFPELGVIAHRINDERAVPFNGASLGASKLGECSFGRLTRVGVHDLEVVLICEDANFHGPTPWVVEGDRRLRAIVFPLLDEVCMTLTVTFVLLDRGTRAQLSPNSYAGYDPMWDSDEHSLPPDPPGRVQLYRGALPREEPDTALLERVLADGLGASLSVDRYAPSNASPELRGRVVELRLVYIAPGRRHVYRATIQWGARAWYRDEPFAITLRCDAVAKTTPSPRDHSRLWSLLRDQARTRIADRLTHEVMASIETERVTVELVDHLIDAHDYEHLYALVWSKAAPMQSWEGAAWQRFSTWSAA